MSSVLHLREFIRERLTAAAEEIFTEVEKNVVQYEEELDRQRKLLEISWKPRIQLQRIDVPHQLVSKDKEAPSADQHLYNQRCNSSMNQVEPETLILKEELEDLPIQEEEQLKLKHEMDRFSVAPTHERNDYNDPESNMDDIPVYTCPIDEDLYLEENKLEEPGPARYAELSPDYGNNDNIENSLLLESHSETELTAEKLYICYTCNKRFCYPQSLQKHQAIHSGEKPYSCKTCGKCFSLNAYLLNHMKTHTGEKSYSCKTCKKHFPRKYDQLCHMRSHAWEKPFSCKICGKSFEKNYGLLHHMSSHSGEKQHKCTACEESFHQNSLLVRHMRIHTGEKPYSCKTCGKCFSRNSNLLRHIKTHTGEKPYSCKICGKSFSRNSHLLRHIRTHRGEEISVQNT